MPYRHEWPNIYIWLRGKNALFTYAIVVKTGCTVNMLQGEMCRSSIDNTTRPIMKNVPVVMAFNMPGSCAVAMSNKSTSTFLFA